METFKQYFMEHCKSVTNKPVWVGFNFLQYKILRRVYEKYLSRHPKFMEFNVQTDDKLLMMYFEHIPDALRLLGDVLCKEISDYQVLNHSGDDVNKWADKLYKMIVDQANKTGGGFEEFKESVGDIRLWLDDVRSMPSPYNFHAKTSQEAIEKLKTGKVTHMSFDHDLGPEEAGTGYDVAKWIEEAAYNKEISKIAWRVHSANPIGAKNIERAMQSAERFWHI